MNHKRERDGKSFIMKNHYDAETIKETIRKPKEILFPYEILITLNLIHTQCKQQLLLAEEA